VEGPDVTSILLMTLGAVIALMVGLWIVSLIIRDASIVDIFWGLGFIVVAWTTYALTSTAGLRPLVVCVMTTAWGGRLAAHLARRNLGHGEDYRYRAMRQAHGRLFPLVSLGTVFLLQGVLMWIVSLPIQAAQAPGATGPIGWIDAAGITLWVIGLSFEAVADAQLARFKRSSSGTGAVMDRGLWRYSRHPNYFGDFLVWWGFGLLAISTGAWWALAGPAVMSVLLVNVSGVALLEKTIVERRPAYRAYVARTSAFVPWPPRAAR
jgi:steroid 5-alpha reductase family enzyme